MLYQKASDTHCTAHYGLENIRHAALRHASVVLEVGSRSSEAYYTGVVEVGHEENGVVLIP